MGRRLRNLLVMESHSSGLAAFGIHAEGHSRAIKRDAICLQGFRPRSTAPTVMQGRTGGCLSCHFLIRMIGGWLSCQIDMLSRFKMAGLIFVSKWQGPLRCSCWQGSFSADHRSQAPGGRGRWLLVNAPAVGYVPLKPGQPRQTSGR